MSLARSQVVARRQRIEADDRSLCSGYTALVKDVPEELPMKPSWFTGVAWGGIVAATALAAIVPQTASAADIAEEPAPVVAAKTNCWRFRATILAG